MNRKERETLFNFIDKYFLVTLQLEQTQKLFDEMTEELLEISTRRAVLENLQKNLIRDFEKILFSLTVKEKADESHR